MVSRLADRLKNNPKDADGWIRLMRARMVLGETAAATAALRVGRAAFAGDPMTQGRLDRAAAELGVPRGG
jgi:cytochrome c-type biogenesis protein CcmH